MHETKQNKKSTETEEITKKDRRKSNIQYVKITWGDEKKIQNVQLSLYLFEST